MNELSSWILPLTFIPGVGMLVMSTASRFHNVNGLIRDGLSQGEDQPYMLSLYLRSRRLSRALVALYISVGAFAVAALFGKLTTLAAIERAAHYLADALVLVGVLCVLDASYNLIRESLIAFRSAERECRESGRLRGTSE